MTPNNIVNMALLLGLDAIAVSDHNSSLNLPAVFDAAKNTDLVIIPAIEVCTNEEVHLLCLFHSLNDVMNFNETIYEFLPPIKNNENVFGKQLILDSEDNIIGKEEKLLINALSIGIEQLLKISKSNNGVVIPAHVDKHSYSIISNLGFIPEEYEFTCIEIKNPENKIQFNGKYITNSDAHYLENISEPIHFLEVKEKSIDGIMEYFKEH
ncbi:PHP domain-containing protein [Paludicola sp. MB14-C6]|uniref:PHP domain-containing protein n=1 Tax=Paludihabitans sp. MB14-C6 TaxID=3070656 RepID=UPI0027DBDAFE|nr:PHP domain-containing protein [Paludicola sp. MB14-C6]WMJ23425.1 PHP domain-containing protein [Paludicola sp. MB14-C6]